MEKEIRNVCTYRTHRNWVDTLKKVRLEDKDEVAFWRTSNNSSFKAIEKGEIFFFNVEDKIVGCGTFVGFESSITITDLWNKYGFFAGAKNLDELKNNISEKSNKNTTDTGISNNISYIKLNNISWFGEGVIEEFDKVFGHSIATNPVKKCSIKIIDRE